MYNRDRIHNNVEIMRAIFQPFELLCGTATPTTLMQLEVISVKWFGLVQQNRNPLNPETTSVSMMRK